MIKVISKILHEVGVFAQNSTVYGNPSDDDDGKSTRSHKEVSATEGERAERKTRSHCRSPCIFSKSVECRCLCRQPTNSSNFLGKRSSQFLRFVHAKIRSRCPTLLEHPLNLVEGHATVTAAATSAAAAAAASVAASVAVSTTGESSLNPQDSSLV